MKFKLECDEMDGLVLIDKSYLCELDDEMIYAMDILLDPLGRSELIYDFPDEKWDIVRLRETELLRKFCNSGKMIIWLLDSVDKQCEIKYDDRIDASSKWLHVPSGELIAITAGELIQCISYPELEMEKIFELKIEKGWYAVIDVNMDQITYCKKIPQDSFYDNIQEINY